MNITKPFLILIFAILIAATFQGCAKNRTSKQADLNSREDQIVQRSLQRLKDADPSSDLKQAVQRGDLRFIGIMGYSLIVPAVDNYFTHYHESNGARTIEGTSDFIRNESVSQLNQLAKEYAETYNKLLLKYLNDH